jgi:putative transposase
MSSNSTVVPLRQPDTIDDPLTTILRSGARQLLAQAIEAEADAFLAEMKGLRLPDGRERVVRHGHGPERLIQTGIGPVAVEPVKLCDRGAGEAGDRAHPLHLGDPAALGPADAELGRAAAHPLSARGLDG